MKNFLVLTIILMLGAYGRVVAQDAVAASKRANQQYVLLKVSAIKERTDGYV